MGRFDNSRLNQWNTQAKSPAAPAGQQQAARAAAGYESGNSRFVNSQLGKWTSQQGYVPTARNWYTGANQQGTNNGWDSDFADRFINGWDEAAKKGRLNTYFEQGDATGVVTWDHQSSDGRNEFKFGDIYDNGKKVGNVYDQFDKSTADLMMTDWLFDGQTKAQIFGASDSVERLGREVAAKREQNNRDIPKALQAREFEKGVTAREGQFTKGGIGSSGVGVDEASVLGAGLAGAGLGAGVGSVVPVIGTGIGAAGGFGLGLLGGWLNKDKLTENAARAYQITSMATRENGLASGIFEGVHQWSGFGGKLLSPLSNLTQGAYDASKGEIGDGTSEFYRVDDKGERQVPKWVKVADIGASVGDALLQFSNPTGVALYTSQMSGTILGEVGSMTFSGGETFDDRRGGFDNVFTNDKGELDLKAAGAGIGKIGIDVVQLGVGRGLVGKADSSMRAIGKEGTYNTGRLAEKLPSWAGGQPQVVKDTLAKGGSQVEAAGFKYTLDAGGQVVHKRAALSLLAPSEQLVSLSAANIARRAAARRGGAASADDFYRAAQSLAQGERKFTSAIVNGLGEGYEEAVQSILEPMSHNASFTGGEIAEAFIYGAAAGAGMTMGANLHTSTADEKMFAQAKVNHAIQTGGAELSKDEWKGMTDVQKRTVSAMQGLDKATADAAYAKVIDDQAHEMNAGVVGAVKLQDAIQSVLTQQLSKMTDRTDGAFVITQIEDAGVLDADGNIAPTDATTMPSDAVGASGLQTLSNLKDHLRGVNVQRTSLKRTLVDVAAEAAANPENEDAAARQAELEGRVAQIELTLEWGRRILEDLEVQVSRMYDDTATPESVAAEVAVTNAGLRAMFNEEDPTGDTLTPEDKRAIARAVSMIFGRDPHDSSGSYQMLVPQVSAKLTMERADNVLQVSHAILPAIRGDFDGDKMRPLNQLILDDNEFVSARSGAHFLGAGNSVNVGAPKYEKWVVEFMAKSLASGNQTLSSFAEGSLIEIGVALRNRYTGVVPQDVLDSVIESFFAAVRSNSKDARATLLDGLATKAGGAITEFSRNNLSNEWLWIDQLVRSSMQKFQEAYAAHRPDIGPLPDTNSGVSPSKQSPAVREVKQAKAATMGQSMAQALVGDSMFRMFQKLHYTSITSPVVSAESTQTRAGIREMAQFYEALGQGLTTSELENIRAKDAITGRVLAQLQRLAQDFAQVAPGQDPVQALTVIANLEVLDIDIDLEGNVESNGKTVSLAQLLLKRSVQQDRRDKDVIFDASPELQAKHARLLGMTTPGGRGDSNPVNAERAFVEVVGSQQLFTLLGDDAYIFGPHLTVEQFLRYYTSLNELDRRRLDSQLRSESAYLGRKQSKNMPYQLSEIEDVSAYRSVVDAIVGVGHHRISIDTATGKLSGEIAERSDKVSDNFKIAHKNARQALQQFAGISGRKDGELTEELVQRMLESNPDFARQVMGLIPNASAHAVFEIRDKNVWISNWVHRMFTIKNPVEAEMHYWRNLLLAERNAQNATDVTEEGAVEGESSRRYDQLHRRMLRIMYRLAKNDDGGLLYQQFINKLESSTDLTQFIRWVNQTPGIRGEQAPITAWVDDVAEFDPDKAQGGWTTALSGAELREAIGSLRVGSERLVKSLSEEKAAWNADVQTLQAIRRVERFDSGDTNVTLDSGDRELHRQFAKAIEQAGELFVGLGPQAMIYESMFAVQGFYAQAHTKGKNPTNVEAPGAFEAWRDALDYVTNYERVMAALTAMNLDAVSGNLGMIAKDSVRTMDDYGRVVEWEKPTVSQMLDLLENADTRPLARAVLFPQVMERTLNGSISPQLLVGKNLKSLLNGSTLRDLFPKNDRLSQDSALRYVSMLEAQARRFGGHFSVQRAVNDIVIAQTSAATTPLTQADIEAMVVKAYHTVAQIVQTASSIESFSMDPAADPLEQIRRDISSMLRRRQTADRLGLKGEDQVLTDIALDELIQARERELEEEIAQLETLIGSTPAEIESIAAQVEAAQADFAAFRQQVEAMRSDDNIGAVVSMFSIPGDKVEAAAKKDAIVDYISTHLGLVERASSATLTLNKLTNQLLDSGRAGQVDMTDEEWDLLSRVVIGDYLSEAAGRAGNNLSVSPFPDADHAQDQRYFDTSFSYLLDPLLKPDSPVILAGRELHRLAGRQQIVATDTELIELIDRTLYKDFSFGRWTGDLPRASMEANQRLDSAAAAQAIAMAGNSPKRQGVISAATRRTFVRPDEAMAATTTVNLRMLSRPLYDSISVQLPGSEGGVLRPLAQLNNRFASSVVATFPDGSTEDLLATSDLGRRWQGNQTVVDSGYKEIHVERLQAAITAEALRRGVRAEDVSVEVSFFHPDSQPAGPEWYNNIYFEGTSFNLDADRFESLNSTLWFANDSISPAAQAAALDASKLGKPALQVIPTPSSDERAAMEETWAVDLTSVLRAKTKAILETDMGFGKLDPEFYNAVYKNLKLRHFVRGLNADGVPVLMTAEEVIAHQQTTPGEPLPIENAALWIPTDDVLRSMLGEQGTQGVTRVFEDQLEFDLAAVPTYRGITNTMLGRFAEGVSGGVSTLQQTRVVNRAHQSQLVVRSMIDEKARSAYETRMKFLAAKREDIWDERRQDSGRADSRFSTRDNLARALQAGDASLRAENIAFDWTGAGIPFIGPRKPADSALSALLLQDLAAAISTDNASRTGWIYREGATSNPIEGLLSEVSLAKERKGMRVAPDDLVVVEVDSFNGDVDLARRRIDYFAANGATVVLVDPGGQGDLRAELGAALEANNYQRAAGSVHVYVPADLGSRFQNPRARASTLLETRGVSTRNQVAVFNTTGLAIEEGAGWVNPGNERLGAISVTMNLVPTSAFGNYNVPVEGFSNESQIEKIRAHLRGFDNEVGRTFLRDMATASIQGEAEKEAAAIEFDGAFTRMLQRFDSTDGTVLPAPGDEFGTGDIIPLIDPMGHVLLYRHGYKAPRDRLAIDEMQARTRPGSANASNVAVYSAIPEDAATTHRGEVVRFTTRAGYGLQVELNLPLQLFGDKKQLEWNGMKYVLTPKPDSVQLPEHGFFENWGIDIISDADTAFSKESFDGLVNNHRNAFAYFGIDFLPDMATFFGTDERSTRELLRSIATGAERLTVTAAEELLHSQRLGAAFAEKLLPLSATQQERLGIDPNWVDRMNESTVEAQIARAMVIYLMVPGAKVEDVLQSGGFNDESTSADFQSRFMPRLFTQVFDDALLDSDLRIEINKRLNTQLNNPNRDGTGYRLHTDFTFEVRNTDPRKNMRGFLQFAEAHSSGDNPIKNGMSFDDTGRGAVSQHSASIAYQAIGAETAAAYDLTKARLFASGSGITRFDRDTRDGGVWRMLTTTGADRSFVPWRMDTPAEAARRSLAREARVQFTVAIDQDEANGWTDKLKQQYLDLSQSIVQQLRLQTNQAGIVDGWVRQIMGMPAGVNDDGKQHHVSGKQAVEAAKDILWNVEHNYLPVVGAEVPLLDVQDLQLIFRANQNKSNGWNPREDMDPDSPPVSSWDDWVKVSLGGAFTSEELFDPLYLLALDGFMHTYQNATQSLLDLPVSMDALKAEDLLLPETNRLLVSLDPNTQQSTIEPALLNSERATLDDMLGGQRIAGRLRGRAAPASEIAKRRNTRRKWRAENGVPVPLDVTMRNFRKNGAEFVDHGTNTNALVRSLINLRVGSALINPALWVSMGPEALVRGAIDKMANIITGRGTSGFIARRQAGITEWLDGTATGEVLDRMGLTAEYTQEQQQKLSSLYKVLGQRSDFKGMVYRDLMFQRPRAHGIGRFERALEGYAKFGSKMQDPTHGMRANTLARRYMEAAMQHIEARPTVNPISTDTLIAEMMTNPLFLQQNYPEAHQAASNAIAQLRSLKQTPLSMALRSIYEPLSESSNAFVNVSSNILLKLPLLFSGYAMNVVTTITGLQGLSDMTAMFIDGRDKPGLVRRMQAAMRGELGTYDPDKAEQFDMSEIIEGIDLSRSFIRGGLTHTSLFALGMMAGGLGLTGEDDEERRRRRAAELQGAGYIYDPRKMENDFRNADATWIMGIPVQMPWIAKQFLSPIIGMERFFDTGDTRQIMWGFQDALGSFPLINSLSWYDAVETAGDFGAMADAAAADGSGPGVVASSDFLMKMVGTYERMLFENSFVNQLYQSADKYDRDPYAQPLLDSDETTQVDAMGEPRESTALRQYIDEDGNIREGYVGRSAASARLHQLTENRATLATALSIFTGFGDSSFFRRNMVPKTRSFEAPVATDEEAKAVVQSLSQGLGGSANLTMEEAMNILRNQGVGGKYARNSELEPLAKQLAAEAGAAPMSVLDDNGREVLTHEGARGVMRGLAKGSVRLGDPSLRGIHITYEQRNAIAEEWMAEIIQEGMDMGLDQTKATSRMKRLWSGPLDQPDVQGLGDILYSKDISYSDKLEYNQLNTTFVLGPDGMPWATGFGRPGLFGALGLKPQVQITPDKGMDGQYTGIMSLDERMNSVDLAAGQNLGLRALEPVNEKIPTDAEIGKALEEAMTKAASSSYTPFTPYASTGGGGGFGGYGGGGGGGGGGGSYAPTVYFSRMNPFSDQRVPYGDDIPFINTSNPILRRADVRRERVWSERGRLKQWQ